MSLSEPERVNRTDSVTFEGFELTKGKTKLIGTGTWGSVLIGFDTKQPGRQVAMKMIRGPSGSGDRMGLNEVKVMKTLSSRHSEHVVRFFAAGNYRNSYCIAMELCNQDLFGYMKEKKFLLDAELLHLMRHIVSGMKVLQEFNVFHRDLKPNNIFLSYTTKRVIWDVTFKIGDFGISRIMPPDGKKLMSYAGTGKFVAPEILERKGGDTRSDLWSLGMILHFCSFGRLPYPSCKLTREHMKEEVRKLKVDLEWITNEDLKNLMTGLLEKQPEKRMPFAELENHPFLLSEKQMRMDEDRETLENMLEIMRKGKLNFLSEYLQIKHQSTASPAADVHAGL